MQCKNWTRNLQLNTRPLYKHKGRPTLVQSQVRYWLIAFLHSKLAYLTVIEVAFRASYIVSLARHCPSERERVVILSLVGISEVLPSGLGVRLDGLGAGLPVGRAHLSVLVCVLESLHQPQGLFHRSGYREINLLCGLYRHIAPYLIIQLVVPNISESVHRTLYTCSVTLRKVLHYIIFL